MAYAAGPSNRSSQHRCAGWPCMHRPPKHPLQPCAITTQLPPPCVAAGAAAAAVVLHCHRCNTNAAAAAAATVAASSHCCNHCWPCLKSEHVPTICSCHCHMQLEYAHKPTATRCAASTRSSRAIKGPCVLMTVCTEANGGAYYRQLNCSTRRCDTHGQVWPHQHEWYHTSVCASAHEQILCYIQEKLHCVRAP